MSIIGVFISANSSDVPLNPGDGFLILIVLGVIAIILTAQPASVISTKPEDFDQHKSGRKDAISRRLFFVRVFSSIGAIIATNKLHIAYAATCSYGAVCNCFARTTYPFSCDGCDCAAHPCTECWTIVFEVSSLFCCPPSPKKLCFQVWAPARYYIFCEECPC